VPAGATKFSTVPPKKHMRRSAYFDWIGEETEAAGAAPPLIREDPSESTDQADEQYGCGRWKYRGKGDGPEE